MREFEYQKETFNKSLFIYTAFFRLSAPKYNRWRYYSILQALSRNQLGAGGVRFHIANRYFALCAEGRRSLVVLCLNPLLNPLFSYHPSQDLHNYYIKSHNEILTNISNCDIIGKN